MTCHFDFQIYIAETSRHTLTSRKLGKAQHYLSFLMLIRILNAYYKSCIIYHDSLQEFYFSMADANAQVEALRQFRERRNEEWQKVRNPGVITESKNRFLIFFSAYLDNYFSYTWPT